MRFDFREIFKELNEEVSDSEITIRLGKTGAGKTLIQTEINVLPALIAGQDVMACYWLNWNLPNFEYFKPRDFSKVEYVCNRVIVFDEIRRSFDPRGYKDESEAFRLFVEDSRHRHNTIIGNTQDLSLVAKTFSVQTHNWSQLEKVSKTFFKRFVDKVFENENVCINEDFLTFQDLRKISIGFDLNMNPDFIPSWETHKFKKIDLLHRELNDFKIELVHKYCPKCRHRQGKQILKADTSLMCEIFYLTPDSFPVYSLKPIAFEYCPKCKITPLIARESGMFDTDYLPEGFEARA